MTQHIEEINKEWRERLEEAMVKKGYNYRTLSLESGLGETYVRDVLRRNNTPVLGKFIAMAKTLRVSIDYLVYGNDINNEKTISIPVINWIKAGSMCQPTVHNETLEWIEFPANKRGSFFGLRVYSDSMDLISPPESTIVVDRLDKKLVSNACYVIADVEGNATYKRFRPNPMRFEPVSKNPDHTPIFPDQEPLIVGRVKRTYLDL